MIGRHVVVVPHHFPDPFDGRVDHITDVDGIRHVLLSELESDLLEVLGLASNCGLSWKPFHRARAVKAMTMTGFAEHESRVGWSCNGAAVAKHDDVRPHIKRCLRDGVDAIYTCRKGQGGLGSDGATSRQAHMRDDDVRSGASHGLG